MPFLLTRLVKDSGLIAENSNADQVQEKLSKAAFFATTATFLTRLRKGLEGLLRGL